MIPLLPESRGLNLGSVVYGQREDEEESQRGARRTILSSDTIIGTVLGRYTVCISYIIFILV